MRRIRLDSTASERLERRKRTWLVLGIVLVVLVILIVGLYFGLRHKKGDTPDPNPNPNPDPTCPLVKEDVQRVDCHPDRPITQKSCLARGCCYIEASDLKVTNDDLINSSYFGVPSCFFPPDYKGYKLETNKTDGNTINAEFKRVTPSGFPKDVEKIVLDVTPIDDNRLQIQVNIV